MDLSQEVIQILLNAEAKALATVANNEVNVVPVSSVKVVDSKIWLIDYFFDKTLSIIQQNPNVALTFWVGLRGYQIKAKVNYLIEGAEFITATNWIAEIHPNRIVRGLLVLETQEIFDISIHNKRI
ncbi:MAG: pyridoxamine 5'-phosphate oxidase family protein [Flavobacteriaceae bacterium]|nr:pyridoxamine 5'-phosphate oxidase family protein [Flavobacteriaceae bacterium]